MSAEYVVLVDKEDNELGLMEKLQAHREGRLHRAVSVFVVNSKRQWLLQRRAHHKYHSGGLWTNTSCSHPRHNEDPQLAAERRLKEEMGIECALTYQFNFIYEARLDNDLTEHELDHVYIGYSDDVPVPNADEVSEFRYAHPDEIEKDVMENPGLYTVWFKLILGKVKNLLE